MTKQQKTYLLIIAVLGIWGIIGYRIYNQLTSSNTLPKSTLDQIVFKPKLLKKVDSYVFNESYRDPFLGKIVSDKKVVKKKKNSRSKTNTEPFPDIVYNGLVERNGSKSFIISVNGNQELFKLGNTINDVQLVRGSSKEIKLRYNKQVKTFKQQ